MRLTAEKAFELLDAAVEKKGYDYIYKLERRVPDNLIVDKETGEEVVCLYSENGEPSCIIGHLYYDLMGTTVPLSLEGKFAGQTLRDGGLHFDSNLKGALSAIQADQDQGVCWGRAVDRGKAYYQRLVEDDYNG